MIWEVPVLGKSSSSLMKCDVAPKLMMMICSFCCFCLLCFLSILCVHLFDFGRCSALVDCWSFFISSFGSSLSSFL